MKILQINTLYGKGSTGKIAQGIHDVCKKKNIECMTAYRYVENKDIVIEDTMTISSWFDCHVHNRLVKYTLLQGCYSRVKTRLFFHKVDKYNPDIIHLHNLHGSYINLWQLFRYIKKNDIKVIWTLHDCWAFTGQCPHFTIAKCDKWKTECFSCPQYSSLNNSIKRMFVLKKKWFCGVKNMILVTPSEWLAALVKQSFLKEYPTIVINNGIDLNIFKPTSNDFRCKYNILDSKSIILGVSFGWSYKKGLDVFIELAKRLDGEQYQIVLVGTDNNIDKNLPDNVISIHRTNNQKELAEIYTVADLFVNPTREENYPTVNMEALACGTPVLTFRTGGSPEIVDETCGNIIDCDDIDAMEQEIIKICKNKQYSIEACLEKARNFDMNDRFEEYVKLYENCTYSAKCAL